MNYKCFRVSVPKLSAEPSKACSDVQEGAQCVKPGKNATLADEQKLLMERLQRLEEDISHRKASSNQRNSPGRLKEPLLNIKPSRDKRIKGGRE